MQKRYFLYFLPLLFAISCKKTDVRSYQGEKIELKLEAELLSWTKVNSEEFVRYDLYRSNATIADPKPGGTVNATKIFTTSNSEVTSAIDSINLTQGNSYYRLFVVFKSRQLGSNEVVGLNSINFLPATISTSLVAPKLNRIYASAGSTKAFIYDYANDSILKTITGNFTLSRAAFGELDNEDVVFYTPIGTAIINVLDANTFTQKSNIVIPGITTMVGSMQYHNHKLYISTSSPAKILIWDLQGDSVISEVLMPTNNQSKLHVTKDGSKLFAISQVLNTITRFAIQPEGSLQNQNSITAPSNYLVTENLFSLSDNGDKFAADINGNVADSAFNFLFQIDKPVLGSFTITTYKFVKNSSILLSYFRNTGDIDEIQVNNANTGAFITSFTLNSSSSTLNSRIIEYDNYAVVMFVTTDPNSNNFITAIKKIKLEL